MSSRQYKKVIDRSQGSLFPPSLDESIHTNNPVRAIEAYVNTLKMDALGFQNCQLGKHASGQPAYDPAMLIKLYLYGYLNQIRSSRKLDRETYRNIEVIWLTEQQHPCYKTIADFRKNNAKALRAVNKDFILLCRELRLFGGEVVAIDGSFFKGNAGSNSIHTKKQLEKAIERLDRQIASYQHELNSNDQLEEPNNTEPSSEDPELTDKLKKLKARQLEKTSLLEQLQASGEKQISTTDEDARLLNKSGKTIIGYNVQTAIDDKHHLMAASDVTNEGNDKEQLYPMASKAKDNLDADKLDALADTGYFNGEHIKTCEESNITPYVAEPSSNRLSSTDPHYRREAYIYDAENNQYRCPQGNILKQQGGLQKKHKRKCYCFVSQAKNCATCPVQKKCLGEKSKVKKLYRWEHEEILEQHRQRMADSPEKMMQRSALVEHPFGTLKDRMGYTYHFLVRGFEKVRGEWSLMATCYNFTRVLNILGVKAFLEYCHSRNRVKV
jgi:transposase